MAALPRPPLTHGQEKAARPGRAPKNGRRTASTARRRRARPTEATARAGARGRAGGDPDAAAAAAAAAALQLAPLQSNISLALGRACVGARRVGRLTRMQMEEEGGGGGHEEGGLCVWHRTRGASWAVIVRRDRERGTCVVYPDLCTARLHMEAQGGAAPGVAPGVAPPTTRTDGVPGVAPPTTRAGGPPIASTADGVAFW